LPAGLLVRLALDEAAFGRGARLAGLIANSFVLAAISALVVTSAALILAYAARVTREAGPARAIGAANQIAGLGYAIPGAVIAVGVLLPLGRLDNWLVDWASAWFGAKIGLVLTGSLIALVYAYLVRFLAIALQTVESGLSRITPNMDDAARGLGLPALQILARVHAPMLRPSVLAAALLVFVDVMKELPASFALRPFNFDTLAIEIYNLAKDERLGEAALPSLLIVAVGLVPLAILSRQIARGRKTLGI
jgi:iron(III) transport system permease protein